MKNNLLRTAALVAVIFMPIGIPAAGADSDMRDEERAALAAELQMLRENMREELRDLRNRYPDNSAAFAEAIDEWQERRHAAFENWRTRLDAFNESEAADAPMPVRDLPPDADEATVLAFALRAERREVREAHAGRPAEERQAAILAWHAENEHRFEELQRLRAERDSAERLSDPAPVERDYSGLSPEVRALYEERDRMRVERRAILAAFGPGQEEERIAALIAWRDANEERLESWHARMEQTSQNDER